MQRKTRAATLIVLGVLVALVGCGRRGPADSSAADFTTAAKRIKWMEGRMRIDPPSPISDAHFCERESKTRGGHMGPGYSMYWLLAKIEIDPQDAEKWAAVTKSINAPSWRRDRNPLHSETEAWSISPEEFDAAKWYDPAPLVGTSAHGGYITGYMLIPDEGNAVYIWQHWR